MRVISSIKLVARIYGSHLERLQFRWLKIKEIDAASPISITLFSYYQK